MRTYACPCLRRTHLRGQVVVVLSQTLALLRSGACPDLQSAGVEGCNVERGWVGGWVGAGAGWGGGGPLSEAPSGRALGST
mgnify:CR=1 FL=1